MPDPRRDPVWQRVEEERRRRFRRVVGGSALAHAAAFALMVFAPETRSSLAMPAVVSVDLVSLPAAAVAAPEPAPAQPAPAPPKPAPKRPVVLPKTPQRAPEPKRPVKPKPRPQPRSTPPPPPPEDAPESAEYEDVLAELRALAGEKRPERAEPRAAAPGGPSGPGVRVPPEVAAWMRSARVHVRQAWVLPPGFRDAPLETHLEVQIDAGGRLQGEPRVTRRSGNPWFDEGVVRAMQKASPLPPPPRPGTWPFVFRPEDLL